MRSHHGRVLAWALVVALAGCAPTPGTTDTAASPTPRAIPAGTAAIEPGTYRIPKSAWSVVDFTVTFPEGWTVQYGHTYLKQSDAPDELGFYAVVVEEIYTDACEGDGQLMEVGPSVDDLAIALLQQPGPMASGPVDTTLGGYPASRIDLTVPEGFDLKACRLGGLGLRFGTARLRTSTSSSCPMASRVCTSSTWTVSARCS